MKSNPHEWNLKNEATLKHVSYRPNLIISEHLIVEKERILAIIFSSILSPEMSDILVNYQIMESGILKSAISSIYNVLALAVRQSDKSIMVEYTLDIAKERYESDYTCEEVKKALDLIQNIIISDVLNNKDLGIDKQEIYDFVGITMQLAMDEVEDVYEQFGKTKLI